MSTFSTPTPPKWDAGPSNLHPTLRSRLVFLQYYDLLSVLMSDWTEASSEMGVAQNKRYCRAFSCIFPRPYVNEQS